MRRECTLCPSNTQQCAHIDGYWVRLTHSPDCTNRSGVPAVARNFGPESHNPDIVPIQWTDFYHPPLTFTDAEDDFHMRDAEMRKLLR